MSNTQANAPAAMTELLLLAASEKKLKKAVYSKPSDKTLQKSVLTLRESGGKTFLQIERFHRDNKVTHKNFSTGDAEALLAFSEDYGQINLLTSVGECELRRSSSGKTVLLGGDKLKKALSAEGGEQIAPVANNREKQYILDGSEPFLRYLDVSDANGRVRDRKQSKFRQINRFLELIRDVEDRLPRGELRICDLCCGKSYLSFAVYHYFANVKGYRVSMTGVDLKPDVIEHCNKTAKDLGFDGLEFLCGDIREYTPEVLPSLVISLHACDSATDLVLLKVAEWNTDVILSTPCCHHELNHSISCPELSFITDYSMLRQKLCDAATDALRLCRLEASGYAVMALELIDPEETPKNVMLRAVRRKGFQKDSAEAKEKQRRYLAAKEFLCQGKDLDTFLF